MFKVKLTDTHPLLDGEYDLGDWHPTNWEGHCIREAVNLTLTELEAAGNRGDPDALVAIAMVALMRAGKIPKRPAPWASEEMVALWDAAIGDIDVETEDDARPPDSAAETNAESASSGDSSANGSESPASHPNATGEQTSPTTSTSDRVT